MVKINHTVEKPAAPVIETKAAGENDGRHWVLVTGDTASWLDQNGLIVAYEETSSGKTVLCPLFVPGRTMTQVLASPFAGVVPKGEGETVPVDVSAVPGPSPTEVVVETQVDFLGAGLQDSQRGVRSDGEFNSVPRIGLEVQPDGPRTWPLLPVSDATDERIQSGFISPQRGVPVDHEPSHKTSPSVGAPDGAVCDNSNPTEGDLTARPIRELFPAPSHEALADSITALAATQRRLLIDGRLAVDR